jgi:hypothetical protein
MVTADVVHATTGSGGISCTRSLAAAAASDPHTAILHACGRLVALTELAQEKRPHVHVYQKSTQRKKKSQHAYTDICTRTTCHVVHVHFFYSILGRD